MDGGSYRRRRRSSGKVRVLEGFFSRGVDVLGILRIRLGKREEGYVGRVSEMIWGRDLVGDGKFRMCWEFLVLGFSSGSCFIFIWFLGCFGKWV